MSRNVIWKCAELHTLSRIHFLMRSGNFRKGRVKCPIISIVKFTRNVGTVVKFCSCTENISWFFVKLLWRCCCKNEPQRDKTNKMMCAQQRQISLDIRPVWSESSLSTWRNLGSLATYWANSEDSDQTERMPSSLGAHAILLGFVTRWPISHSTTTLCSFISSLIFLTVNAIINILTQKRNIRFIRFCIFWTSKIVSNKIKQIFSRKSGTHKVATVLIFLHSHNVYQI